MAFFSLRNAENNIFGTFRVRDATLIIPVGVSETNTRGDTIIVPRGAAGDAGAPGARGSDGPVGFAGPQGKMGARGKTGNTGPAGSVGATGAPGKSDPAGPTGLAGAKGPRGIAVTGHTGPQGPVGPTGDTGAYGTGPQGPVGPRGYNGTRGPVGDTGPDGPGGITGPTGTLLGPTGDTGPPGLETGVTGPDNPGGAPGAIGPVGSVGPLGYGFYRVFPLAFYGDGHMGAVVYGNGTHSLTQHVMATRITVAVGAVVWTNGYVLMARESITLDGTVRATWHELDNTTAHTPLRNYTDSESCGPFTPPSSCGGGVRLARPTANHTCFAGGIGGETAGGYPRAPCGRRPDSPVSVFAGDGSNGYYGRVWGGGTEGGATGLARAGRGGGVVALFTPSLRGSGEIDARGEDGAAALGSTPDPGAGGGGGGLIVLMTGDWPEDLATLRLRVEGGRGGRGFSNGTDGLAGSPGIIVRWWCI
jgi:hypothetical protein